MAKFHRYLSTVALCLIISGVQPFFALSAEDTVHLTFSKKIDGGERHSLYRVQRGDWLTRIIRKELNPRENDMAALIEKIQVLNPHIRDMNVIYPGQLLRLPAANGPMEKMSVRGQSPLPEEKAISHGERTLSHRVERGETVTRIMRRRWGMNIHQARMHLEKIRSLNPHIKDLNRIYPGQIIYFPAPNERRRENGTDVDEAASKAAISGRMQAVKVPNQEWTPLLKQFFSLIGGEVACSGEYYLPLPPSSQMIVDCATVPVVELKNGERIIIDFYGRIPLPVKHTIESHWKHYHIVSGTEKPSISLILERAVKALRSLTLQKKGVTATAGSNPQVAIDCDWTVSGKIPGARDEITIGIRVIPAPAKATPPALIAYAARNGLEVIEIVDGYGPVTPEGPLWSLPVSRVKREIAVDFTDAFLRELGYVPARKVVIPVFLMKDDGFDLSVEADLVLSLGGRDLIFDFESLSPEFRQLLQKRGEPVVELSKRDRDIDLIRKITAALNLPALEGRFSFPPADELSGGWRILFSGLKVQGINSELYFVKGDYDEELHHLLHEKWSVKVVSY